MAALWVGLLELGALGRRAATGLLGGAPCARASGLRSGARHLPGGRPHPRRVLSRAALSASRGHPPRRPPRPGWRGCRQRRPGPNLARRLRDRQAAVLRCVSDPRGPCTHNPAERDLRRRQLRRKLSGGFRSAQGARAGAPLRSLLATARQQGLHRSETLLLGPDALFARLPV